MLNTVTSVTENNFEKVVSALATIQAYADSKNISIDVELETVPHPKLINGPRFPTGREVLVVRVPYERTREFLTEQLKRMQEQRAKLTETVSLTDAEILDLQAELQRVLGAPKLDH